MIASRLVSDFNISQRLSIGIGGNVSYFVEANTQQEVQSLAKYATAKKLPLIIMGGGTNLIFSDRFFDGIVLCVATKGIYEYHKDKNFVYLDVEAGEEFDKFVEYCIKNKYWGCENLSYIPGTVGALPVQNVGAYGQEVKNIISSVKCYDRLNDSFIEISNAECDFGFRKSVFNSKEPNRYIICSVRFCLSLKPKPLLFRSEFSSLRKKNISNPFLLYEIRETVRLYRMNGKNLPLDDNLGSVGTFFKTAILSSFSDFNKVVFTTAYKIGLKAGISILLFSIKYRSSEGFRIPSKLLIQLCGLSKLKIGEISLYPTNPAVVVANIYEPVSSQDLVKIIKTVRSTVLNKTGVLIPIEPTMIGFDGEI